MDGKKSAYPRSVPLWVHCFRGAVLAALLTLPLLFSPLLGIPGPESALLLAAVFPLWVGLWSLWDASNQKSLQKKDSLALRSNRSDELESDFGEVGNKPRAAHRAVVFGFASIATPTALLFLRAFLSNACDPVAGLSLLVMGPGIGCLLASMLGAWLGKVLPSRAVGMGIFVALVLASIGHAFADFLHTPQIFAYGHFFGWFPGALYDPDIEVREAYLTFRAFSICLLLALWFLLSLSVHRKPASRFARLALAFCFLFAASWGEAHAVDFGHRASVSRITSELGSQERGEHCLVVAPSEVSRFEVHRLVRDCDFRVEQTSRVLGLRPPALIRAFFFRSAEEKRTLMGAADTEIAKPFRNEVYLVYERAPHPVLFHELAHVIAGSIGTGPFRIAARFGVIPSPGLVEGLAVAVAYEPRDGMVPHEWARAMLDLGWLPRLSDTEGLRFLLQPASRAYIATGSFLRFVLQTRGNAALRKAYTAGTFAALGNVSELEEEWHRYLLALPMNDERVAYARARFERPSLFGSICPHAIASLERDLGRAFGRQDLDESVRLCQKILSLDANQPTTIARLAAAKANQGVSVESEMNRLVGAPLAIQVYALEQVADAWAKREEWERARETYRVLFENPALPEAQRRTHWVKFYATSLPDLERSLLFQALVGEDGHEADAFYRASKMERLNQLRSDGFGAYLLARQLEQRGHYQDAAVWLRDGIRRGLPHVWLSQEALRMQARVEMELGNWEAACQSARLVSQTSSLSLADELSQEDFSQRLHFSSKAAGRSFTNPPRFDLCD